MAIELLDEHRLVLQPVEMHAVQVQHDISIRIARWGLVNITGMPTNGFGGPNTSHGEDSWLTLVGSRLQPALPCQTPALAGVIGNQNRF
jgi:hypothetical protein